MNLVEEGKSYGSKDYFCKRNVKFQRLCGHHEMVRCERAFELVTSPSRCQEPVVVSNPECGHDCPTTCFEAKQLADTVAKSLKRFKKIAPLEIVEQGDPSNYQNFKLNVQCNQDVTYVRICGHKQKLRCSEARHVTSPCQELVTMELPVCGHVVRLPCHLSESLN
ncbi:hypothetical protein V7S43_009453 [Phytophthora oleae]|uniref:TRAF-type domain-containing protein n=1 Tax=Phytophthora oleae TaxID=2107226 RepID=A0ABD3FEP4_9STRA